MWGGGQTHFEGWWDQLNAILTGTPTIQPIEFLEQAVAIFPNPTPATSQYSQFLPMLVGPKNVMKVALQQETKGTTPQAFADLFNQDIKNIIGDEAFNKASNREAIRRFQEIKASLVSARDTYADVLYLIFARFDSLATDHNIRFPLLISLCTSIRGAVPKLNRIIVELHNNILACGAANPVTTIYQYILQNIRPGKPEAPDILVILEVISGRGPKRYQSIDGAGATGVMELLQMLRVFNPHYCLVPPVRLSTAIGEEGGRDMEGIAVFYDSSKLQFMGPQKWTANNAQDMGSADASQNYAPVWQATPFTVKTTAGVVDGCALPNRQVQIAGSPFPENQLAGQCIYPIAGERRIHWFGGEQGRPPLLTVFQELGGAKRTIKLCSMHATRGRSAEAVDEISQVPAITNLGANEVSVLVGDFNVDLLSADKKAAAYDRLVADGYALVLENTLAQAPDFVGTTLERETKHNLLQGTYPGFGYLKTLGAEEDQRIESLDNILVKGCDYTGGMVLNRVVGVDATQAAGNNPAPGAGTLHYGYPTAPGSLTQGPFSCAMATTAEAIQRGARTQRNRAMEEDIVFRQIQNYGKIRGASDHMALVVDV